MAAIDARAPSTSPALTLGVSLTAHEWARMTGLILIGLLPFAALGIVFGHLLTPDSIGPVMGGATALLAILGGTWFPITGGAMTKIGEALPSYWLVQASHVALGGKGWTTTGWVVIAVWTRRRRRRSRAGPTGATRSGSSARPAAYDVTDAVTDASSGSSQATACAERLRVGRLEHDLDLGPVGREARVGADRDVRPADRRAVEQVHDVALARLVGAPPRRDRRCRPRTPRRRRRTSPPSRPAGPGSTQTFSSTNPGAPPFGFRSGRLPAGSCAQRAA